MPIKTDNIYNIDKKFDYFTIKAMVIESLQKILLAAKQEQEEQGQQQQTITFDYKALVGEEGDDDDDDELELVSSEAASSSSCGTCSMNLHSAHARARGPTRPAALLPGASFRHRQRLPYPRAPAVLPR